MRCPAVWQQKKSTFPHWCSTKDEWTMNLSQLPWVKPDHTIFCPVIDAFSEAKCLLNGKMNGASIGHSSASDCVSLWQYLEVMHVKESLLFPVRAGILDLILFHPFPFLLRLPPLFCTLMFKRWLSQFLWTKRNEVLGRFHTSIASVSPIKLWARMCFRLDVWTQHSQTL